MGQETFKGTSFSLRNPFGSIFGRVFPPFSILMGDSNCPPEQTVTEEAGVPLNPCREAVSVNLPKFCWDSQHSMKMGVG